MKLYLLPKDDGELFLYAGRLKRDPEPDREDDDPSAARKVVRKTKKVYHRVTRRQREQEALLKKLGSVDRVRVVYPSSMSESEARRHYDELIEAEIQKHKKWMFVDAAAVPVSVPLSVIPGPNVILAYLAWRTAMHYKVKKAGERATELSVDFEADDRLSELTEAVSEKEASRRKARIRAVGEALGLRELERAY